MATTNEQPVDGILSRLRRVDMDSLEAGENPEKISPSYIFQSEETHLARALFRRGESAMRDCTFQDGFLTPVLSESGYVIASITETKDGPYQPLDGSREFRILALEPGAPTEPLKCSFVSATLAGDCPSFEAISYCWGNPSDTIEILCCGHPTPITRNLSDMLHKVRSTKETRYLWADAICINQRDHVELGQQVAIMRPIYQRAERVLVWLGQDIEKKAYEAFKLICTIIKIWRLPLDMEIVDGFAEYEGKISADTTGEFDGLPKANDPIWDNFVTLFSLPWFHRVWVIQEVTVSQSTVLLWGDFSIAWPLVGLVAAWIMTKGHHRMRERPINQAYNAFLMYTLPVPGNSAFSPIPFTILVGITRGVFDSTDPRDRIYGMLGMNSLNANPDKELFMVPDYSKSTKEVYTEATVRMLKFDKHLRVLSAVQHGPIIESDYPSWVPQWHSSPLEGFGFRDENDFFAAGGKMFEPTEETFSHGPGTLLLHGMIVTRATEVSHLMDKGAIGFEPGCQWTEPWYGIIDQLANSKKEYRTTWSAMREKFILPRDGIPEGSKCINYFGRGSGGYKQREQTDTSRGFLSEFLLYWKERSCWDASWRNYDERLMKYIEEASSANIESSERVFAALYATKGRKVFRSKEGNIGLGPAAMQPGDCVCVLYGAIVPFILRFKGDHWQLVGECFFEGQMNGEIIEHSLKDDCDKHELKFLIK